MKRLYVAAMMAALAGMGTDARAQFDTPRIFCVPGATGGCALVTYGGGTSIFLQNLQGSFRSASDPHFDIQGVVAELQTPGLAWRTTSTPDYVDGGFDGPVPTGCQSEEGEHDCLRLHTYGWYPDWYDPMDYPAPSNDEPLFTEAVGYNAWAWHGILGCNYLDSDLSPRDYVAISCPRRGYDAGAGMMFDYGLYDIATNEPVRSTRLGDLRITLQTTSGTCDIDTGSGSDCDEYAYHPGAFVATPEPGSIVLLGTGLAGIAGMGLVRRRRTWWRTSDVDAPTSTT